MLENEDSPREIHPILMLLFVLLTVVGGFVIIGPLLGILFSLPFFDGGLLDLAESLQAPLAHPELEVPLYIMQTSATLIGLIVGPAILLWTYRRSTLSFFQFRSIDQRSLMLVPVLMLFFMGFMSIFIEWNANLHFPEALKGFEEWARENEDARTDLTKMLTTFDSVGELLVALVVIAILPAIGEELVFRGLIQGELYKASKNPHVAIWVATFLFSAFHVQFFGFVPRLLLGALFGYLYYWSGNLSIAVLGHFINNGLAVTGLYFYQRGAIEYNLEETEALPWGAIVICAAATAVILYYFKKNYQPLHAAPLS